MEEHNKLVGEILKRDKKRRKRIEAAGIDYECPEMVIANVLYYISHYYLVLQILLIYACLLNWSRNYLFANLTITWIGFP